MKKVGEILQGENGRRIVIGGLIVILVLLVLGAAVVLTPPKPTVVEKEVPVTVMTEKEVPVTKEVQVTIEVEKPVVQTVVVEKEIVKEVPVEVVKVVEKSVIQTVVEKPMVVLESSTPVPPTAVPTPRVVAGSTSISPCRMQGKLKDGQKVPCIRCYWDGKESIAKCDYKVEGDERFYTATQKELLESLLWWQPL